MKVLLVTSPNEKCGIREHSELLMSALPGDLRVDSIGPDKASVLQCLQETSYQYLGKTDIVHIDHHAALHAVWDRHACDDLRRRGYRVVITQHDTFESLALMEERGLPNFGDYETETGIHRSVDALIVHEPVEGLTDQGYDNVYYWRQPVPELPLDTPDWPEPSGYLKPLNDPPIVGSVGFDFPWKGFEQLQEAAVAAGWKTRILGGSEGWLSRDTLLKELRKCDATAFLYGTGNSGTSAAIRMGIAARRPVIATRCRQFRDLDILMEDTPVIFWTDHPELSLEALQGTELRRRVTATIQNLAALDSWSNAGRRYAALYRGLHT